jgi:hypothetical protein
MAAKTITTSYDSDVDLVITVIDDTSGDILDDTDGAFRSELTAALPTVALAEHTIANGFDTNILGRHERSENRIPWPDGNKTILFRESGSSTVLLQQSMRTENDIEVDTLAAFANIDVAVSTRQPAIAGANACTITVYENGTTTPIADYQIDIYNSDESLYLGPITTNALGQAAVNLDSATYKLRGRKSQFVPVNAVETYVVDGAHLTKTIYATAWAIPVAASADCQTLYGNVVRLNWAVATGDKVKAKILGQVLINGSLVQNLKLESTIDVSGNFSLTVPKTAKILVTVEHHGDYELTVTSDNNRDIADYLAA